MLKIIIFLKKGVAIYIYLCYYKRVAEMLQNKKVSFG